MTIDPGLQKRFEELSHHPECLYQYAVTARFLLAELDKNAAQFNGTTSLAFKDFVRNYRQIFQDFLQLVEEKSNGKPALAAYEAWRQENPV